MFGRTHGSMFGRNIALGYCVRKHKVDQSELKQMEPFLNFQVPAEGLELVILLHTQD